MDRMFDPSGRNPASRTDRPESRDPGGVSPEHREIVVIGGGPAGLAAALGARRAGANDVLVLERERIPGGILNQCIHDGFGLFLYNESVSGPEYAERLFEDVEKQEVACETGSMVLDLTGERLLRVNSRSGYRLIQAESVILAMGCRERTREMLEIPGTRPAGVITAGTAQNLVNLQNIRIGKRIVILGSGDIGLIMARRMVFEGSEVVGVFEILPWVSGLERNVRQCLADFDIPLELSSTVVEIKGKDRVESVTVAAVDESLKPVPGTEREVVCDTLLLSVGLVPENELSRKAGIVLSPLTGGALVDETLMTTVQGIFSCGNVLHIHDIADWASFEGMRAGEFAARFVKEEFAPAATFAVRPGPGLRYCLPQRIREGSRDPEISFRVTHPFRGQRVVVKGMQSGESRFRKMFHRLAPSELQKIILKGTVDEDLEVRCDE